MPQGTAARLRLLAAAVLATGCSPPPDGNSAGPPMAREPAAAVVASLSAIRPRAVLRPAPCGAADMVLEVAERSGAAPPVGYVLTVHALRGGRESRIAAHSPYPLGAAGRLPIRADQCRGAEALRVAIAPVGSDPLPAGLRVDVSLRPAAPSEPPI